MKYQDDDFNEMILYITALKDENISLKIEQEKLHKKQILKTDLTVWGISDASKFVGCARNTLRDILKIAIN